MMLVNLPPPPTEKTVNSDAIEACFCHIEMTKICSMPVEYETKYLFGAKPNLAVLESGVSSNKFINLLGLFKFNKREIGCM